LVENENNKPITALAGRNVVFTKLRGIVQVNSAPLERWVFVGGFILPICGSAGAKLSITKLLLCFNRTGAQDRWSRVKSAK